MKYPEYAEINGKRYKINTDFRVAIKCNEVALDKNISDYERALAIIYILFGEEGLNNEKDYKDLLRISISYLACGKKVNNKKQEKLDMDYIQDMDYIEASFMSDYGIDLTNETMHWWKFSNLINGLSNSELGNTCILNRIRNIRNMNQNEIKDQKERKKIIELQKEFALKKNEKEKKKLTEKEKTSAVEFLNMLRNGKE